MGRGITPPLNGRALPITRRPFAGPGRAEANPAEVRGTAGYHAPMPGGPAPGHRVADIAEPLFCLRSP